MRLIDTDIVKRGDIIINPWVSIYFNDKPNPMYATIYIGDNRSIDFNGEVHEWADKVYKEDERRQTPWEVIGHVNLFSLIWGSVDENMLKKVSWTVSE